MAENTDNGSRLLSYSEQFRTEQMARKSISTSMIGKESEYNSTNSAAKSDGDMWGKDSQTNPGNVEDINARVTMETRNTLWNKQREYNSSTVNTPIR